MITTLIRPFLWGSCFLIWSYYAYRTPNNAPFQFFEEKMTYFWFLIGFLIWLNALAVLQRPIRDWLRKHGFQKLPFWGTVISFQVLWAVFTWNTVHPQFHSYYDESTYLSVAQQMYVSHSATGCREGHYFNKNTLKCTSAFNDPHPHLMSFMASLAFRLFGFGRHAVFFMNIILNQLTGVMILILCLRLQVGRVGSVLGMLVWDFWPLVIQRSLSGGLETVAGFTMILALLVTSFYLDFREPTQKSTGKTNKKKLNKKTDPHPSYESNGLRSAMADVLLGLTLGLSSQARPESCLFIALAMLPALLRAGHLAYLFSVLSFIPSIVMRKITLVGGPQQDVSSYFVPAQFFSTLIDNFHWLVDISGPQKFTQPVFSFLCVAGCLFYIYDHRKKRYLETMPWIMWAGMAFYSLTYFSNFYINNLNMRYAISIIPVACVMAGYAVKQFERFTPRFRLLSQTLTFFVLVGGFYLNFDVFEKKDLYTRQAPKLEDEFFLEYSSFLPKNSILFVGEGDVFITYGFAVYGFHKIVAQTNATQESWKELVDLSENHLYYLKGWECFYDPGDTRFTPYEKVHLRECQDIEKRFNLVEVARKIAGGYDIILYQITGFK